MSGVTRPRGPLPRRVYWARRLVVVGLSLALVYAVAHVLGRSSDGKDPGERAQVVDARPHPHKPRSTPKRQGSATAHAKPTESSKPTPTPLAVPTGPCEESDVIVTADPGQAVAGGDVAITLLFTTRASAACTFEVSSDSVVVKLTSGNDRIWSSQDCPRSVPDETVTARQDHPGKAVLIWDGRRSDPGCNGRTDWALPGYYHADAAAFGSDPTDAQFKLSTPPRPTITPTPTPKKHKND